jgi:hypothetical protein
VPAAVHRIVVRLGVVRAVGLPVRRRIVAPVRPRNQQRRRRRRSSASSSSSSSSSTPRTLALHESTSASVSTTLALAAKGLQAAERTHDALQEDGMPAVAEAMDTDEAPQLGPGNESAQGLRVAALEAKLPDAIEQITYYSTLVAKLQPAPAADALQSGACHMSMQVVRDAAEQPVEDCGALDAAMGANVSMMRQLTRFDYYIVSSAPPTPPFFTFVCRRGRRLRFPPSAALRQRR